MRSREGIRQATRNNRPKHSPICAIQSCTAYSFTTALRPRTRPCSLDFISTPQSITRKYGITPKTEWLQEENDGFRHKAKPNINKLQDHRLFLTTNRSCMILINGVPWLQLSCETWLLPWDTWASNFHKRVLRRTLTHEQPRRECWCRSKVLEEAPLMKRRRNQTANDRRLKILHTRMCFRPKLLAGNGFSVRGTGFLKVRTRQLIQPESFFFLFCF